MRAQLRILSHLHSPSTAAMQIEFVWRTVAKKTETKRVFAVRFFQFAELRYLFATRCIESDVDIPTVSRWLGHKDGGALAMKTYCHLRREHSIAQVQRVTLAPIPLKQANIIAFPAINS
jgi:hypothetical protein